LLLAPLVGLAADMALALSVAKRASEIAFSAFPALLYLRPVEIGRRSAAALSPAHDVRSINSGAKLLKSTTGQPLIANPRSIP